MDTIAATLTLMLFLAPPILCVWLSIYVGSRTLGKYITVTFLLGSFPLTLLYLSWLQSSTAEACVIDESECLGARGFSVLAFAYLGLFLIAGGVSTFLNVKKWRNANSGAN